MAEWVRTEPAGYRRVPPDSLTLRPEAPRLTIESVSALRTMLGEAILDPHVVLDLRGVDHVDPAAVDAVVLVDRWLSEQRAGSLAVRVATSGQLKAFESADGAPRCRVLIG